MKRLLFLTILISINIFASGLASFDILQNSKIKKIYIKPNNTTRSINHIITQGGYTFDNNSKILVKFKTIPSSVKSFESKYNLKFVKIMAIGYFVFENTNHSDLSHKLSTIIQTEQSDKEYDIDTIKPNWKLNNIKY
jgi:hypothetical protein